jgi:hypothetical protein
MAGEINKHHSNKWSDLKFASLRASVRAPLIFAQTVAFVFWTRLEHKQQKNGGKIYLNAPWRKEAVFNDRNFPWS